MLQIVMLSRNSYEVQIEKREETSFGWFALFVYQKLNKSGLIVQTKFYRKINCDLDEKHRSDNCLRRGCISDLLTMETDKN